jgi:protein arginine N-methyltransferase 3
MKLSFYDTLCVINYIRGERLQGRDPRGPLEAIESCDDAPWKDERYLMPVIENDPMLLHSWGELDMPPGQVESGVFDDVAKELLEGLDLNDPTLRELLRQQGAASQDGTSGRLDKDGDSSDEVDNVATDAEDIDQQYFESYSFMDIHREMLEDKVRTNAYRSVLEKNVGLMSGATVLDVGCGTGVLSIFAARGGASKVVAVDGSPAISKVAENIFIRNGYSSEQNGPIKVLSSKIENLDSLGDIDKVDVIVSEWMGYALLFESMLDSVLLARDRFLKPGGAILPDVANIYVALGSREAEGLSFWSNIYDIDMSLVARSLRDYCTSCLISYLNDIVIYILKVIVFN